MECIVNKSGKAHCGRSTFLCDRHGSFFLNEKRPSPSTQSIFNIIIVFYYTSLYAKIVHWLNSSIVELSKGGNHNLWNSKC